MRRGWHNVAMRVGGWHNVAMRVRGRHNEAASARSHRRVLGASVVAVTVAAAGCTRASVVDRGDPLGHPRLISALVPFPACDDLLAYLRDGARKLVSEQVMKGYAMRDATAGSVAAAGPLGAPVPAPMSSATTAPAATAATAEAGSAEGAFSTTNDQEAGADEPDTVKTDGRRLFTMSGSRLEIVDVSGAEPAQAGVVDLGPQAAGSELLLAGDRVLALHGGLAATPGGPAGPALGVARVMPATTAVGLTTVDVSDAAHPRVVGELSFDGSLVAARLVDGVARVVLRAEAPAAMWNPPADEAARSAAIDALTLDDWLPHYRWADSATGSISGGRVTDCSAVSHPADFSGLGMVSVVAVDPADPRPGPGASVVGAGEVVYATPEHLYVTSTTWTPPVAVPEPAPAPGAGVSSGPAVAVPGGATTTAVHEFDIADKVRTAYLASGQVAGQALNQYALSEHHGDLRIATTRLDTGDSQVAVLRREGAKLAQIGVVGGLGAGERIYAVRFVGDLGYVVTFRQTDPLHVVDLSDPTRPTLRGELAIPGYSAYLHPLGDGLLLGVGQDMPTQGRAVQLGTQLSLFDVGDPANPTRLSQVGLGAGRAGAEYDPHAFLWWPAEHLAAVPVMSYAPPPGAVPGSSSSGAPVSGTAPAAPGTPTTSVPPAPPAVTGPRQEIVGFTVTRGGGIVERGRLAVGQVGQARTVVVGGRVLAVDPTGIVAASITDFAPTSRLAF